MTIIVGTLFVFVRTAAMLLVAPVLGNRAVPAYVKAILALTIALAISPLVLEKSTFEISFSDFQVHLLISKLVNEAIVGTCLLYTSPSPRDQRGSRMPSSA